MGWIVNKGLLYDDAEKESLKVDTYEPAGASAQWLPEDAVPKCPTACNGCSLKSSHNPVEPFGGVEFRSIDPDRCVSLSKLRRMHWLLWYQHFLHTGMLLWVDALGWNHSLFNGVRSLNFSDFFQFTIERVGDKRWILSAPNNTAYNYPIYGFRVPTEFGWYAYGVKMGAVQVGDVIVFEPASLAHYNVQLVITRICGFVQRGTTYGVVIETSADAANYNIREDGYATLDVVQCRVYREGADPPRWIEQMITVSAHVERWVEWLNDQEKPKPCKHAVPVMNKDCNYLRRLTDPTKEEGENIERDGWAIDKDGRCWYCEKIHDWRLVNDQIEYYQASKISEFEPACANTACDSYEPFDIFEAHKHLSQVIAGITIAVDKGAKNESPYPPRYYFTRVDQPSLYQLTTKTIFNQLPNPILHTEVPQWYLTTGIGAGIRCDITSTDIIAVDDAVNNLGTYMYWWNSPNSRGWLEDIAEGKHEFMLWGNPPSWSHNRDRATRVFGADWVLRNSEGLCCMRVGQGMAWTPRFRKQRFWIPAITVGRNYDGGWYTVTWDSSSCIIELKRFVQSGKTPKTLCSRSVVSAENVGWNRWKLSLAHDTHMTLGYDPNTNTYFPVSYLAGGGEGFPLPDNLHFVSPLDNLACRGFATGGVREGNLVKITTAEGERWGYVEWAQACGGALYGDNQQIPGLTTDNTQFPTDIFRLDVVQCVIFGDTPTFEDSTIEVYSDSPPLLGSETVAVVKKSDGSTISTGITLSPPFRIYLGRGGIENAIGANGEFCVSVESA